MLTLLPDFLGLITGSTVYIGLLISR